MTTKIISDSASNVLSLDKVAFETVPLTISIDGQDFKDDTSLSIETLVDKLHQGEKTSTACPSIAAWQEAFAGYDEIFAVTITSKLSGSYSSAVQAAQLYMEDHPKVKIHVIDSKSAGPSIALIIEHLEDLVASGMPFEAIVTEIEAYTNKAKLSFALENLENLAKNGRVKPAVAKLATMLKIRLVGIAQDGELTPIGKPRGLKKTVAIMLKDMEERNYTGGKVIIAHTLNETAANVLKASIINIYPKAQIKITQTRGLCTYYAQKGGLMLGFEGK